MRKDRAARTLVVDDRTTYLWSVRHKHRDGDVRRDVLHLVLDGVRTRVVFREGERRGISDGYGLPGAAELDGWDLFDVVLRCAAAATAAAPPGCPPGP
ncbi:hypothetical protein OG806_17425 [Streptomyces sp. NBC_00882]|uniref:hypothetical protein n=1 Tax=Streptomyces TaxID=1883 RepID=UPI003870BF35|nr:hypothetical protein OG806_17425 [Streptomyces sp. NBC_00882]WSZ57956.1 hypothetical protein OH824_15970 [Streptomyces canus]